MSCTKKRFVRKQNLRMKTDNNKKFFFLVKVLQPYRDKQLIEEQPEGFRLYLLIRSSIASTHSSPINML